MDIFCKIIKGETDTKFLFEEKDLVVFADIKPSTPIHYLVVPRKHIETINETTPSDAELLGHMILAAAKAARMMNVEDGYKLVFNVGKGGGQIVRHIHLHLLAGFQPEKSDIKYLINKNDK